MKIVDEDEENKAAGDATAGNDSKSLYVTIVGRLESNHILCLAMEVDSTSTSKRASKNRISKRKKTSKIVFPKYSDRKKNNTKKR